jgi:ATPase subunit of ABC transporter with duplicated ATPase domains
MVNPVIGSAVNAKQTQLDRLKARQIKAPFIEIREPEIILPEVELPACTCVCEEGAEEAENCTCGFDADAPVLSVTNYNVAFDKELLEDVNFALSAGEKVAIVGANGTGKTTLFRMIMGLEEPTSGSFRVGETVKLAYVDQQHKSIDPEKSVYEVISQNSDLITLGNRTINARAYVSRFNFSGTDQEKKCGMLSGGERNRLHLALALKEEGNVLLLDEPTNDIDVNTLRALEEGLENFAGCAVVISHDRWFLDRIATHILSFEGDSKVVFFEGSYSEYEEHKRAMGEDTTPKRVKYKKLME